MYHGYHICSSKFVERFKTLFCEEKTEIDDKNLGALFANPVMNKCNIVSQSVSYLRLMQFERYFTDPRDCGCPVTEDHQADCPDKLQLHHLRTQEGHKLDTQTYKAVIDKQIESNKQRQNQGRVNNLFTHKSKE